jgi:PPOX class probable F420-dependent enzyme
MVCIEIPMSTSAGFALLEGRRYLNLETFRKNGQGVRTPVWFAAGPASGIARGVAKLYVYSTSDSGKVKRIRNSGRARIAPCDRGGQVLGAWIDVRVELVTGEEAQHGMRLLNKKYVPWKQILDVLAMFGRRGRVVLAIRSA